MSPALDTIRHLYWKTRFVVGLGTSKVGERFGMDALTYNTVVMDLFAHVASEAAPAFARAVLEQLPEVRTVVDFGCGTGHFVRAFADRGLSAQGFERSSYARRYARARLDLEILDFDLERDALAIPLCDLAISLEVAEHLPAILGDRLVDLLTSAAPLVVFSAAQPGQGGMGHVNEQPLSYWELRFVRRGFESDSDATEQLRMRLRAEAPLSPWLGRNATVYRAAAGARE